MSRHRALAIGTVLLVGIGVLAVALLRSVAPPAPDAPRPAEAADAVLPAIPAVPPPAAASAIAEAPPPWAAGLGADASAQAGSAEPTLRERQLAELQQSMTLMLDDAVQRSQASSAHMRKALDTLEAMDDPAVKAQIDLATLRHNMEISLQMQALAQEMRAAVATPKTPQRDAAIDALQLRFEALRHQLRTNTAPAGATAPPTAPREG